VVGLPLTILFSALSGEEATTPDQLPPHLTGGVVVASVILAVFVAPVVEETYFRGILFRSIRDRHGFWPGALISGVIFGLVHWVPSPWQDAVLLQSIMVFTGIALAWIYERRGSIVADIAAHMAFNLVGIVLILRFSCPAGPYPHAEGRWPDGDVREPGVVRGVPHRDQRVGPLPR